MVEGLKNLSQLEILEAILIKCKINESVFLPIFFFNMLAKRINESSDQIVTEHFQFLVFDLGLLWKGYLLCEAVWLVKPALLLCFSKTNE